MRYHVEINVEMKDKDDPNPMANLKTTPDPIPLTPLIYAAGFLLAYIMKNCPDKSDAILYEVKQLALQARL